MQRLAAMMWRLRWPRRMREFGVRALDVWPLGRLLLPHFVVGVVGIVTNERDELLLFRHTYRRSAPWGLPAGFLERGEQPEQALVREIEEESGFDVDISPVRTVYADPDRAVVTVVFSGVLTGGSFRPSEEVDDARFFNQHDLPPLPREQRRLLDMFLHERGSALRV